jgi:hypothetical protein
MYKSYLYTGCTVIPGSELSQASCWSPDDERGVGGTITICEKSPVEAAVATAAARHQKVAVLHHTVLAVTDINKTAWVSREGLFLK